MHHYLKVAPDGVTVLSRFARPEPLAGYITYEAARAGGKRFFYVPTQIVRAPIGPNEAPTGPVDTDLTTARATSTYGKPA